VLPDAACPVARAVVDWVTTKPTSASSSATTAAIVLDRRIVTMVRFPFFVRL